MPMNCDRDSSQTRVAIIIVNWKNWPDTLECLESVAAVQTPQWSTIVFDNGSTNESVGRLADYMRSKDGLNCLTEESNKIAFDPDKQNWAFLQHPRNSGFARACNLSIEFAMRFEFDYIFLLNNDAVIQPDTLSYLVKLSRETNSPLVGASVVDPETGQSSFQGAQWPHHLFGKTQALPYDPERKARPTFYVEGSSMLVRRDFVEYAIDERGFFFDENLFMYCDDTDLGLFARQNGHSCFISEQAAIFHGHSKSSGGKGSPLAFYYITRNRIYIANRWCSFWLKSLFHLYYAPSRIVLQLPRLLRGNRLTVLASLAGLIDGYRGIKGKWRYHDDPKNLNLRSLLR